MIVVDASVLADLLLQPREAIRIEARLFGEDRAWQAPQFIDVEVLHVLRRHTLGGLLDAHRARVLIGLYRLFRVRRHAHHPYLHRIWEMRDNLTAYDAAYVALAETLDVPLITRDARLARSAGHNALIELV